MSSISTAIRHFRLPCAISLKMDVVEMIPGLSLPVATSLKTTMEGSVVVDFDVLLAMDAIADTYSCMRSEFYSGKLKKVKRTHVWYWKINEGRLMIIVGESVSPEIAKTVVVRSSFGKAEKKENLGHLMGAVSLSWASTYFLGNSHLVKIIDLVN